MSEIRYFTDGEQATAEVLNRPSKDLELVDSVMSKVQFEANAIARRQSFAGSGFIKWGSDNNNNSYTAINKGLYLKNPGAPLIETGAPGYLYMHRGSILEDAPVVNVNGREIILTGSILDNIDNIWSDDVSSSAYGKMTIPLPEAPTPTKIITDINNVDYNIKQGDFAILNMTKNQIENSTFDTTDGWTAAEGGCDIEAIDNALKITITTSAEDWSGARYYVTGIKGSILTFNFQNATNISRSMVRVYYKKGGFKDYYSTGLDEKVIELENTISGFTIYINHNNDDEASIEVTRATLYTDTGVHVVAMRDCQAGKEGYFELRDSVSRQDLVFLETWDEKISDKDIVYPYGNVQYNEGNVDRLTGITKGTFSGHDTYSLYGVWQEPGSLVGKGYKWSDMSLEDKIKFSSNKSNNVYRDGNDWKQFRYRIRTIKGLGNEWASLNNYGNESRIGYDTSSSGIVIKGAKTSSKDYIYSSGGAGDPYIYFGGSSYNYYYDKNGLWHGFNDRNIGNQAMPIALVQRRNAGIWHDVFNPEGTAKVYVDGSALYSWETNIVNSEEDCFDEAMIAAINPNTLEVSRLSSHTDEHVSTGSIASGVSGRPDKLYYDCVNDRDVNDLRMSALKRSLDEIREEYELKVKDNILRGNESQTYTSKHEFSFNKAADDYTSILSWRTPNDMHISEFISSILDVNQTPLLCVLADGTTYFLKYYDKYIYNGRILGVYVRFYKHLNGSPVNVHEGLNNWAKNPLFEGSFIFYKTFGENNHTSLKYNKYKGHCDIIGDPRKLSDRVKYTVVDGTSQVVSLLRNDYVLNDDGHIYRALVARDDIDLDTDDYADTTNWIDLGTDGSIGGYPQEWLDNGIAGTPLIADDNGHSQMPVDKFVTTLDIKLSRKAFIFNKCLIRKKDGSWFEDEGHSNITVSNNYGWSFSNYEELGYNSVQELLDLTLIKVYYETKSNYLHADHFRSSLSLGNMTLDKRHSSTLVSGTINKISQGKYNDTSYKFFSNPTLAVSGISGAISTAHLESTSYPVEHEALKLSYFGYDSFDFAVKSLSFLTSSDNRAMLQFIFKELRYDGDTDEWTDDNKLQVCDYISSITDINGNRTLYGQKSVKLPYFIGDN